MPAKRYIRVVLIAVAGTILISACGSDPNAFRGTVVAPLETISALTPGPKLFATLTAQPAATQRVTEARPATPMPQPATSTPRPATPTPRPPTPTPRPPTATSRPATPNPLPTPAGDAIPTVNPNAYLDVPQQVGSLGDVWTLSDIRVGIHPRKVRVVWEMAENHDTAPLTEIVEVDNTKTPFPRRGVLFDPSWGAARIDVMIRDSYAYGMSLGDILPITLPGNTVLTKIDQYPTFDDAVLGFSIGLTRPVAYEIFTLTDPVRIVIDVVTQP